MIKKENPGACRRGAAMLLLFSLAVSVLLGFAMPVHAADGGRATLRTLRVGFYAYTGYHVMDADGNRSGYAYETLQDMAEYENLNYEYLGYDCDVNEIMDMLENGEVDIVPMLRKTPEREERFDFSAEPISNIATMLTVKAGNRSIVAGDYSTYDGMIVGVSRTGNGRNDSFKAYAEEHGFRYTLVSYDTDEELSSALRTGEITAAVSNRMRQTKNEWIIDTFDVQDSYIAVRKGDAPTLRLVNNAIAAMNRDNPSWRTTLFNKYYTGSHTSSKIYLTDAEENYVTACNNAGTEFTVLVNPDRYPYSYMTPDGVPTGIMVEIFKKAAGRARLRYKFLKPADRSEYKAMLADGQADFVIDLTDDLSQAEDYGYKLTDSYLSAEFSWVLLRRHSGALNRIAVAYDFSSSLEMPGLSDTAHVEYLDSFDDCLAAVRDGTVDAYYTYTYQAERTVFDDTHNELRSMLSDEQRNFCIGVRQDYDVLLRTVLNKSIDSLTRTEIGTITNAYVNLGQQPFSLTRLAYQYPSIIALTCLCILITAVCIVLVIRAQRFRAETEKALRKAEEASVAKTEFLSNMSHDIRTPINGIMGMLDIAEDNFDNKARVRDCMTKMRGAASHLLSLINDVLDMTKIESGNMQMLDTPFDLRALLESCCSIVEGQIADRHMTFTKQIGPFWHPYLIGSELHIRQVLINILSNSVKYTPDGGEINFRAKETLFEEGLVHLRMEIKDNGIGMSEEFLQHIFEPFTQEQRSSRTHYKGTGLGMAITKKLVDQMHGSLDVESEPGKGSTFIVRLSLPVGTPPKDEPSVVVRHTAAAAASAAASGSSWNDAPAAAAETSPAAPAAAEAAPPLAGLHLLLAEDNELNSEIATTLLEEQGAKITAVENGRLALEAVQNAAPRTYDAILMDVMMPEMNGLEATRCIRAYEGKGPGEGTPIIAMTANVFADDVKACLDAGMNSHVGKPLDMKVLIGEILKYTDAR
ncbi:ATP-binding protein [uncultured Gemmiger sp.]|uniref:ATP-binding protein n=1 Tax=uncultured Gemmiger sp. TaxID=1623490 RepID=UPI002599A0F0|nr:transporter substrate-binding domain-containing protein [uncultured Gemmiger sp.]